MGTPNNLLDVAQRAGAKLCRDAIWHDGRCNWIGATYEPREPTPKKLHRTLGPDLYDGTAGVGFFLAALYSVIDDEIFRMTAIGAVQHAISQKRSLLADNRSSLYLGEIGIAFSAMVVAELCSANHLRRDIGDLLADVEQLDPATQQSDVVAGMASGVSALLLLAEHYALPNLANTAVRFGRELLGRAIRSDAGCSWSTVPGSDTHIAGYGHGASGILVALMELYSVSNIDEFLVTACEARKFEESCFDQHAQNWRDLRPFVPEDHAAGNTSWCNGSGGIWLSRLRASRIHEEEWWQQEAKIAQGTTMNHVSQFLSGGTSNLSLCHGVSGSMDAAMVAIEHEQADVSPIVENFFRCLPDIVNRDGWTSGLLDGEEVPGLFLGVSGVGYTCLRYAYPDNFPSILLLRPDRRITAPSGVTYETTAR